jgi:hypothetical protein
VFQVCGQNLALETILPKKKPMSSNFTKKIHLLPKKNPHLTPSPQKFLQKKTQMTPRTPQTFPKKTQTLLVCLVRNGVGVFW